MPSSTSAAAPASPRPLFAAPCASATGAAASTPAAPPAAPTPTTSATGPTAARRLANLISFCKGHHRLVHGNGNGYIIAATATGFAFSTKDGTPVPRCPQLPQGPSDITTAHDAAITPATINPPHSGERLNLSLAIWIAFANARIRADRVAT